MKLTWATALGWRLQRQLLDPRGTGSVAEVVARMGAVPAWPDLAAELAIGARRSSGQYGDATRALDRGELVKAFTFRGATHLMTPQDAGAYLAVRASGRMWELPSWQSFYELSPADWPRFREHVRDSLADGPLTRSELVAALRRSSRYRHLARIVEDGNETLLKPLTWQGDMGLGPVRDGEPTFRRLDDIPGWAGIPALEEAGPELVTAYLRTYGPTTTDRLHDWLGKGLGARRAAVARWVEEVTERCEHVDVEGDRALVLAEDVVELAATPASASVRLLPGRDPWVMAPGSSDTRVLPAAHRDVVSRSANLVVFRGVVCGTWAVRGTRLEISWFGEAGRAPRTALEQESARLAELLDRPLDATITTLTP